MVRVLGFVHSIYGYLNGWTLDTSLAPSLFNECNNPIRNVFHLEELAGADFEEYLANTINSLPADENLRKWIEIPFLIGDHEGLRDEDIRKYLQSARFVGW